MKTVSTRPMWFLLGLCAGLGIAAYTNGQWLSGVFETLIAAAVLLTLHRGRRKPERHRPNWYAR